jgi:hypothetical protein
VVTRKKILSQLTAKIAGIPLYIIVSNSILSNNIKINIQETSGHNVLKGVDRREQLKTY